MTAAIAHPLGELAGLPFRKMNGLGNDFVIIDLRAHRGVRVTAEAARYLGDRAGPYGCDQIISIEDHGGEAYMGIWNADGGAVGACGNAARCVGQILMDESGEAAVAFLTPSGPISAQRAGPARVIVDMGSPRLGWQEIPLADETQDTRYINVKLGPIDNPVLWGPSAVNMGNPHCIFFVEDAEAQALEKFGPMIEHHPMFPERANVSVAEVRSKYEIRLRVWERGAGITKACGTAACAALVAGVRRRVTARKATVILDGGPLAIEWRESDNHVLMAGAVAFDFDGILE